MNGIQITASGYLIKKGTYDLTTDPDYDVSIHTYRTDVPDDAVIYNGKHDPFHKWDGAAWVTQALSLADYKSLRLDLVRNKTNQLKEDGTFTHSAKTFSLRTNKYLMIVGYQQAAVDLVLTYPTNITTTTGEKLAMADATAVKDLYTSMAGALKTIINAGNDIEQLVFDAVDKAAVDAVVDSR